MMKYWSTTNITNCRKPRKHDCLACSLTKRDIEVISDEISTLIWQKKYASSSYNDSRSCVLCCFPFQSPQVTSDKVASHACLNTDRGEANHQVSHKISMTTEARLLEIKVVCSVSIVY